MLTKKRILDSKLKLRKVETPEWEDGEHVFVRILSGPQTEQVQSLLHERDKVEKASPNGAASDMRHMANLCCIFVCDEAGRPVLDPKDASALFDRAFAPIQRCVDEGLAFNHMTEESRKELEEDLKKTVAGEPG